MVKLAKANMNQGMTYSWTGLAQEEVEAAGKAIIIFALGILVVYLTLAAQMRVSRYLHHPARSADGGPGRAAAIAAGSLRRCLRADRVGHADRTFGKELNPDRGICGQLRREGHTIVDAAIEAAELRLRPILMTSFAFILAVCRVFASGAGKLGRHSVGTSVVGGMLLSTILNLFFIPVLYVILQSILGGMHRKPAIGAGGIRSHRFLNRISDFPGVRETDQRPQGCWSRSLTQILRN